MRPLLRRSVLIVALAAVAGAAHASPATAAPWRLTANPLPSGVALRDLSVFGTGGVAAAGDAGAVAVSTNGGGTWLRAPIVDVFPAPILNAVAFTDALHGVAGGDGGALFVTDDGGTTWRRCTFVGAAPTADITDVVLVGTAGYAVERGGLLLSTSDGGGTWRGVSFATTTDLSAVAMAATGQAIAGGADGTILTASGGVWRRMAPVAGNVVDVTLRRSGSTTRAFAATASAVYASSDLLSFAPAFWPGAYESFQVASLDVLDLPEPSLVLASTSGNVGLLRLADGEWTWQASPLSTSDVVRAAPGQGAAYVAAAPSKVLRTVSAGHEPFSITATRNVITVDSSTGVTVTSRVFVAGGIALLERLGGSTTWRDVTRVPWNGEAEALLPFVVAPKYTTEYKAAFALNGTDVEWSPTLRIAVRPRIIPAKKLYELHRGSIYRLWGRVTPRLAGESVDCGPTVAASGTKSRLAAQ